MSTKYRHGDHVPTDVLARRLEELAKAAAKRGEDHDREFTLRVPAELDRDADLVLSEAAKRLMEREAQRYALTTELEDVAANAQWLADIVRSHLPHLPEAREALDASPGASVARVRALKGVCRDDD